MFTKLMVIIVALAATASALLVIRQQRIDTFHEMSLIHQRLLNHERTLWELRSEIAHRCRPSQVRLAMHHVGDSWTPLPRLNSPRHRPQVQLASSATTP